MSFRGYMLLAAGLVFGGALLSQARQNTQRDDQGDSEPKMVDFIADYGYSSRELIRSLGLEEGTQILVGNVAFHHNGTVISCDSAVRYSDRRLDCFKNVIINRDSTFIYGDRVEYNGDLNLARVYSPIIKVIDGDATLYTYNLSFNTKDNMGRWFGGGVMYQQDNVMESENGYFYPDMHELVAVRDVEMKNDSHRIISDSVRYNTETRVASFFSKTYIWTTEGEIISALQGRYNTQDSTYFFSHNAYLLDEFRETWADTIDYAARSRDAVMFGNIQIDDNEHDSSAFGDYGQYWGKRGETMLTRRPSLLNYNAEQGNSDTLYMRADTIFMFVRYPSDRGRDSLSNVENADPNAHLRWVDSLPDSVRVALADSLVPIISNINREKIELVRLADSIMDALYPPAHVDTLPFTDPLLFTDSLPITDTLPHADTLQYAVSEPVHDTLPTPVLERPVPPEVAELRARADELASEADSLSSAERYIRPSMEIAAGAGAGTSVADSLVALRVDSIARADSLIRIDSIRLSDPKAYKRLQHIEKQRLKFERQEAKYLAKAKKREEKEAARSAKREARAAERAAKKAARRSRRAWITETPYSDSVARADSIARIDSLLPSIIDSLEHITPEPAGPQSEADTTMRIFRGWPNVKIWRTDMQAVCDSMVGFSADSTIHMYIEPLLWHSNSQIIADSITLFTANEQIEHAEFYGNPIMGALLGELSLQQFNQVKGQRMQSLFRDGEVYRHDAIGNAQALYYVQEDSIPEPAAFLSATGQSISFFISDQFVDYIDVRTDVDFTVFPMDQIPPEQPTELQGFIWHLERQPTLPDVFDRRVRPSERAAYEALDQPAFPIADRIDRRRKYLIDNRMWGDRTDLLPAYAVEFRNNKLPQQ